jgi:GNAT superfamily N-acetyltransferase
LRVCCSLAIELTARYGRTLSMRIRAATSKDRGAIKKLIAAFPRQLMQDNLPAMSDFFVAEEKCEVVGCCAIEIYSPKIAEVRSLAVRKDFRGKGIATRLINACVRKRLAHVTWERFSQSRAQFPPSTKSVSKRSIAKSTRFSRYFASASRPRHVCLSSNHSVAHLLCVVLIVWATRWKCRRAQASSRGNSRPKDARHLMLDDVAVRCRNV